MLQAGFCCIYSTCDEQRCADDDTEARGKTDAPGEAGPDVFIWRSIARKRSELWNGRYQLSAAGQSGSLCGDIGGDRILAIKPFGLHNQSTAKTKT